MYQKNYNFSNCLSNSAIIPCLCLTAVVVQFSINNGVQWQLLRELDFGSFLEPQVVTIELPPAAKTPHTVFRWWQPQQGENRPTTQSLIGHKQDLMCSSVSGKHSAQWGLDNILIGMNDSARSGFFDTFDGTSPLRHNWYRVVGGEVTADCLSRDSVLNFNSEVMDSELISNTPITSCSSQTFKSAFSFGKWGVYSAWCRRSVNWLLWTCLLDVCFKIQNLDNVNWHCLQRVAQY